MNLSHIILFLIYSNDRPYTCINVLSAIFAILFAEDWIVFVTGRNIPKRICVLNDELRKHLVAE